MSEPAAGTPSCDVDLFDEAVIREPYAHYQAIRDAGPVVWLPRNGLWAIGRYAPLRAALANHEVFSSVGGPGVNEVANAGMRGTIIASDAPEHVAFRRVLGAPLTPAAVREVKDLIAAAADALIADLSARDRFDAVGDMAQILPLTIVRTLVGFPEEGRENMLLWGTAAFDALGPEGERTSAAIRVVGDEIRFVTDPDLRARTDPAGWAAKLFEAGDQGLIRPEQCAALILDYINPSLDTTIKATSALLWFLGRNPDQWEMLRADASLIPHAINEAIRLETPIRAFARVTTRDFEVEGVPLPAGSRVLMLYGAGNRDERKWPDPERFDVTRRPSDHLAFGHGAHSCIGMHLARLEITCLVQAMIARVARIEVIDWQQGINNLLRGLDRLTVRFEAA